MAVARRNEYLPHPVEKNWLRDVRSIIESKPRGYQERMREYIESRGIKCSSGELSEVLAGKASTSVFVGPIHEFLEWAPPIPPTVSRDAGEVIHNLLRATPEQRAFIDQAAEAIVGKSGEEAKQALVAMLKIMPSKPKND